MIIIMCVVHTAHELVGKNLSWESQVVAEGFDVPTCDIIFATVKKNSFIVR